MTDSRAVPYGPDMPRSLVIALLLASAAAHADSHLTLEASAGTGGVPQIYEYSGHVHSNNVDAHPMVFGAGLFVLPELAITLRYATADYVQGEAGDNGSASFIGVSAQAWLTPRLWVAGGTGVMYDDPDTQYNGFRRGIAPAIDLRAGVDVVSTRHVAVNLSLEYTPGLYLGDNITILGILAFAVGVQLR